MTTLFDTWGGSFGTSWGQSWTITIPTPPDPDQGAGGLNVYDPSAIREYRKRALKSQQTQAERDKRLKDEREELQLLVARSYNKAMGIEEPEGVVPTAPSILPRAEENRVAREVRDRALQLGLEASLRQVAAMVRARKAEAIALAEQRDRENRLNLLLAAEQEEEDKLDAAMEAAHSLFELARKALK